MLKNGLYLKASVVVFINNSEFNTSRLNIFQEVSAIANPGKIDFKTFMKNEIIMMSQFSTLNQWELYKAEATRIK